MSAEEQLFNFDGLVGSIHHFHDELVTQASRAVNISLTLRNWLIGCYIEEYERSGIDSPDSRPLIVQEDPQKLYITLQAILQ